MSASSSMTRSSQRRRRARRAKAILRTTSQSRLRLDSSPGRGALGRPGQPYCSLGPDGAQSSGPCSHGQRHCIAAVNLNSGARPFPIAKNFARSARPLPTRQWLPYQGSWHREAMTERLYPMPLHSCQKAALRTTSPSPAVTPLLVGEALAFRKLRLLASGRPPSVAIRDISLRPEGVFPTRGAGIAKR